MLEEVLQVVPSLSQPQEQSICEVMRLPRSSSSYFGATAWPGWGDGSRGQLVESPAVTPWPACNVWPPFCKRFVEGHVGVGEGADFVRSWDFAVDAEYGGGEAVHVIIALPGMMTVGKSTPESSAERAPGILGDVDTDEQKRLVFMFGEVAVELGISRRQGRTRWRRS